MFRAHFYCRADTASGRTSRQQFSSIPTIRTRSTRRSSLGSATVCEKILNTYLTGEILEDLRAIGRDIHSELDERKRFRRAYNAGHRELIDILEVGAFAFFSKLNKPTSVFL